ncbi:ammonium transmembrane transporter [Balamuthia mandrillaris]
MNDTSSASASQDMSATLVEAADNMWLVVCGILIFFMQTGFAMLEVGSVRNQYSRNILFKNTLDVCVGAVVWYAVGFAFAYGDDPENKFIGNKYFFLSEYEESNFSFGFWFFQFAFAATAATIISGAVAERLRFPGYLVITAVMTGFVYPVVAHWIWSEAGWLNASRPGGNGIWDTGVADFAGSAVVHTVGGTAALICSWTVGYRGQYTPNKPRFEKVNGKWNVNALPIYNETLVILGVFMLWFGWYGFNCGSTLVIVGKVEVVGRVAINTTISPAVCSLTTIVLGRVLLLRLPAEEQHFSLSDGANGILAGLVAITAGCAFVDPWGALIIGFLASFVYKGCSELLLKLRIDDPVDAFPVHAGCGVWGTIASALFAMEDNVEDALFADKDLDEDAQYGLFIGGSYRRIVVHLTALVVIVAWTAFWVSILCLVLYWGDRFLSKRRGSSWFIEKGEAAESLGFGSAASFFNPSMAKVGDEMGEMTVVPAATGGSDFRGGKNASPKQRAAEESNSEDGSSSSDYDDEFDGGV